MTRVLHTARISNFESTVCDNEERKMTVDVLEGFILLYVFSAISKTGECLH